MIQDLDKIKKLLATYQQTECILGEIDKKGTCAYCIEGIFALNSDLIETVNKLSGSIKFQNSITKQSYECAIDYQYYPKGIPEFVLSKLLLDNKDKLEMNEQQISRLNQCDLVGWVALNDNIEFTFKQFSLLLDILNDTQLPD